MKIHKNLDHLPGFKNAVITTGTFDGVHKGHLKIIEQVKRIAAELKGESVVVTFHPHPRLILQGKYSSHLKLLTTFDEKMELLEKTGIDHVVVVPFTKEFSETEPDSYISEFLVKKLRARCIITGYDHHFGKNRKGDFRLLKDMSRRFHYQVKEIPEIVLEEIIVSSTRIRHALSDGDVETANEFLGYDFFIEGDVVKGNQLGKKLGYPTANIQIRDENKLIPRYGIYIVGVSKVNGSSDIHPAVMSIGIRPTIEDNRETIEAHIFDFDMNLYDQTLRVHFIKYIRPEIKFDSLDALKEKMQEDEKIAREFWSSRRK